MEASISRSVFLKPIVLAIDIGTSSTRALLFDRSGRCIPKLSAHVRYALTVAESGAAEADAASLLHHVCSCIDAVLAQLHKEDAHVAVAAVGVSTFAGSLLGVDNCNRPVTPLITYADTRSAAYTAPLRHALDEAALHQRTGCRLHAGYWPAQLRWIEAQRPEWTAAADQWITLGDYLQRVLLGAPAVSYSVAAWCGLLDRHTLTWDEELLQTLSLNSAQLAPLVDVEPIPASLTPDYAARWPALRHARWLPAVGDGAAANLGSDCVTPAQAALTVGTTSAMRIVMAGPVDRVPDGLWCYRVDGARPLLGGALAEGGNLFAWARRTLQLPADPDELETRLAALEPDGHGLTFLPLLGGERAPGWRADLRGAIQGLSLASTPEEILRAALEGIALRIGILYTHLQPLLDDGAIIVASGGALLRSPTWLQIMADVIGRPVQPSPVPEASARGAALLALSALGVTPPSSPTTRPAFQPAAAAHARYQTALARQQALYAWLAIAD